MTPEADHVVEAYKASVMAVALATAMALLELTKEIERSRLRAEETQSP